MNARSEPGPRVVLHQFAASHFNEKARWALDWKAIAHVRRTHLPGPHALAIWRLSRQTATPVAVIDGEVVPGSARILDALDRRFPERPLLSEDPALRERALGIEAHFDKGVGPAVRTAVFAVLLEEPDYLCRIFAGHRTPLARSLYRRSIPVLGPVIARANGVTGADAVARAEATACAALDFVARESEATGQLAGRDFGRADLACAALLAVLVDPAHPDMAKPHPMPARVADFLGRWAGHPGAEWVLAQYERHRAPRSARGGEGAGGRGPSFART